MVNNHLAERQTVQEFETKTSLGTSFGLMLFGGRGELVTSWGTRARDLELRQWYYNPYNSLVQGAFANLVKQVSQTPWEVSGDQPRLVRYYQDMLSRAQFDDFGGGWRGFLMRTCLDFLRYDFGTVIEIIGAGPADRPLRGRVTGLAHLDALRCVATGNPDYPIAYWSRITGKLHRMHRTRVARMTDMVDGDERYYGLGLSTLSRVLSIVQREVLMSKYAVQRLDDLPPAGLLVLKGILQKQWDDVQKQYEAGRKRDGESVWANTMALLSPDPGLEVGAEMVPFATTWEHFNYREYVEINVNAIALTIGVDPQDIWPLTGAPLGTGQQSEILASKARGKTYGDLLSVLERFINFFILPESLEFRFKPQDDQQSRTEAEIAGMHAAVAEKLNGMFGAEIAGRYLANTVTAFKDVLLDDAGQLRLPDTDPKADDQTQQDIPEQEAQPAPGDQPGEPGATPETTVTADDETPVEQPDGDGRRVARREHDALAEKSIQSTRLDFENDFEDALAAARAGSVNRRRFGIVLRGLIAKYGRRAFEDGLLEGGVKEAPDADDRATIANLTAEQSAYVTNFSAKVFSEGGISDALAATKPAMWFNKSIQPFNDAGLMSADKNGMYEWVYGDTEHCTDCRRLNGQRHRLKNWVKKNWLPQSSRLECKGFRCKCKFVKRRGEPRGSY